MGDRSNVRKFEKSEQRNIDQAEYRCPRAEVTYPCTRSAVAEKRRYST